MPLYREEPTFIPSQVCGHCPASLKCKGHIMAVLEQSHCPPGELLFWRAHDRQTRGAISKSSLVKSWGIAEVSVAWMHVKLPSGAHLQK